MRELKVRTDERTRDRRRGRLSQTSGFLEDALLQVRTEAAVGEHLDSTFRQLGEILFEADHVEERSSRFDVDEHVDVAVGPIVAARDRAEHANITDAVTRRESAPPEQAHLRRRPRWATFA
jgi:hypothetical protein